MGKWFWIVLPVAVFAVVAALRGLAGRPLPRALLNALSSVLLLGYLLVTAGLGIFWVARQQLPVFDWHYLFGYATVALVVLHLVFNLPTAWRVIVRSGRGRASATSPAAPAPSRAAAPTPRRTALLVGCGAAGLGFVAGRWWPRADGIATAASEPGGTGGLAAVERYHALSSHARRGLLLRAPDLAWQAAPPPFKWLVGADRLPLVDARRLADAAGDAAAPDRDRLGALCWHVAGVTAGRGGLELRAAPSSGALFATELSIVVLREGGLPGLARGPWHYDARDHAFERIAEAGMAGTTVDVTASVDAALGALGLAPGPAAPAALLVATAVFARTGHKYRDRAYRYVLADLGHALENARAAGLALGVPIAFARAFDERRLARAVAVDDGDEGVLAVAALAGELAVGGAWRPAPLDRSDTEATPRGVTAGIHRATSLRRLASAGAANAGDAVAGKPATAPAPRSDDAPSWPAVPALSPTARGRRLEPDADPRAVLDRIATRRSLRRFAPGPLDRATLDAVLGAALAVAPVFSDAVRLRLVAHRVEGLAPGAWRWRDGEWTRTGGRAADGDWPVASRAAALDQDVIGEPPAVVVLSIDRDTFAIDPLGPARGWRHAFLEAGLLGERLYLEAGARGAGACAVGAFHDEEAAALVGVDPGREWVVHFCALGRPA